MMTILNILQQMDRRLFVQKYLGSPNSFLIYTYGFAQHHLFGVIVHLRTYIALL